jgi:hypothetical protein
MRVIKSRRMRWAGHVSCMRKKRNAYSILVEKPEGKRPLARPRHRCDDKIKMDLKQTGWEGVDWINLAQVRSKQQAVVNTIMNVWVPLNEGFLDELRTYQLLKNDSDPKIL